MGRSRGMLRRSLIGIMVVAVLVAAWLAFVTRDYPVGIDAYRVVDDQTLSIQVTGRQPVVVSRDEHVRDCHEHCSQRGLPGLAALTWQCRGVPP